MITRHQRSTLFPYTTLFRSVLIMTLGFLVTAPMTLIIGVILAIKEDATLSLILVVIMPLLVGLILLLMTKAIPLFRIMQVKLDKLRSEERRVGKEGGCRCTPYD